MQLPTGTLTFLFTDIQGSTRLWERQPEEMREALARHDALMRQAVDDNGGVVFKTVGDAFCAAFATAPDALAAALAAQCALHPDDAQPLRLAVRMALHSGAVECRDNDYFGPPLNRLARLLSVGHGDQVLVSAAAHELCRDSLPPACSLVNLGEHRLRDLQRPEIVFQLRHPALPSDFPPLRSLDNPELPNNLPVQLTSFIGREKEVAQVGALVGKTRLLTLTGAGGCGKTRLSLQVAAEALDRFPDGAWVVELAPVTDTELIPQTIAQAVGIRELPGQSVQQTLVEALKPERLMLVLDNCEHLSHACALLVASLLRSCPEVTVLATSREPLGVAGELTYRVPSLSLPDPAKALSVGSLSQYEAVRLFIDRAQLHRPEFEVTSQNAPAVAQVCHRLDGIPLAIELAAARIRSLTVEDINARLSDRFRLLTGGDRTALPRQQTLRAAIDWSYDLLHAQERLLLERLSVFAGGWTLQAAEHVCHGAGVEDWEVIDLLAGLVDRSLVTAEDLDGTTWYRMLETVRQYAVLKLAAGAESERLRRSHRDYFAALAHELAPGLTTASQQACLGRLERDHDNLRGALDHCRGDEGGAEAGLRLAGSLWRFWLIRGHMTEGRQHLARALGHPGAAAPTEWRALALVGAGSLARYQGDYGAARTLLEEGLEIRREMKDSAGLAASFNDLAVLAHDQGDYGTATSLLRQSLGIRRELGDQWGIATTLNNLGNVAQLEGDYAAARAYHQESLDIRRALGDTGTVSASLNNLAVVAYEEGDYRAAAALFEEALALWRQLGDRQNTAYALSNLGSVAYEQGDLAGARVLYEESLAIRRELGDSQGIGMSLMNLGPLECREGNHEKAHALLVECLRLSQRLGQKREVAMVLERLAQLAAAQRQSERAARLWGAAESLREAIGSPLPPNERAEYDGDVGAARESLGAEPFAAAWAQGRAMSIEAAVAHALDDTGLPRG